MLKKVITNNRLKSLKNGNIQKQQDCKKNLHCMWVKQLKKRRSELVKGWVNAVDGTSALARKFN